MRRICNGVEYEFKDGDNIPEKEYPILKYFDIAGLGLPLSYTIDEDKMTFEYLCPRTLQLYECMKNTIKSDTVGLKRVSMGLILIFSKTWEEQAEIIGEA